MDFRKDINGLRAIAVVAVMLYHFGIAGFSGGFVGVDVFFVISGYLMTGLLLKAQARPDFSLLAFYGARCRRILPALLVLCLVMVASGWVILPPFDLKELGLQIASALSFTSNILFYSDSGYFSPLSREKWLLHTWSLSVEWQFYLAFPLMLALLHRLRYRLSINTGLLLLAALSLIACVAVTPYSRDFAFFQLPTRLWELVAGGLVYVYASHNTLAPQRANTLQLLGLLLLAGCITFMNSSLLWPGVYAVLPVLAACLIIYAQAPQAWLCRGLMQHLGNWSYSIYLWHWPAMVALSYMQLRDHVPAVVISVLFSIVMGALSYRFIELPAKRLTAGNYRLVLPVLLTIALAGGLAMGQGFAGRVSPAVQLADSEIGNIFAPEGTCQQLKDQPALWQCGANTPRFAVWGDSHALSIFAAVQKAAGDGTGLLYSQSCPPLENAYLDEKRSHRRCQANTATILADIAALPADLPIILAFRYSYYLYGYNEDPTRQVSLRYTDMTAAEQQADKTAVFAARLEQMLCRAAQGRDHVYVVAPIPELGVDVPRVMSRQLMLADSITPPVLALANYQSRNTVVLKVLHNAAARCGFTLLDPTQPLCANGICQSAQDGRPLYADDDHLSQSSDAFMAPLFAPVFSR